MLFVLPILVLLIAATRQRGQGPSPAPKRRRKAEAAAPKILFATDVFTRHTHEFSGPGAYADCRNMMNRVTFVLPPGQRKPSDAWPGHFGIFSTKITEKQRLFECAGCGVEVWSHLCREVRHQEHMEQLHEAKHRALELGFDDTPVQRLACTTCYEAPAALGQPVPADGAEELADDDTGALVRLYTAAVGRSAGASQHTDTAYIAAAAGGAVGAVAGRTTPDRKILNRSQIPISNSDHRIKAGGIA